MLNIKPFKQVRSLKFKKKKFYTNSVEIIIIIKIQKLKNLSSVDYNSIRLVGFIFDYLFFI